MLISILVDDRAAESLSRKCKHCPADHTQRLNKPSLSCGKVYQDVSHLPCAEVSSQEDVAYPPCELVSETWHTQPVK